MSQSPLDVLEYDEQTAKRGQWEAFEFTLLGDSDIEVVNGSHENPEEHTYSVHVEGGIPSDCTCPAFEYQEGACKHMVAVAIREPVLESATKEPTVKADGGVTLGENESDDSDERPHDCDCGEWNESRDLPCWPCYREGFEEPNREGDERECPECGAELEYGALLDTVTGQRGWSCKECDVIYSSLQLEAGE